jgi:type IX secretion system substrate protein/outer membrane protein Omp28
VIMLSYHGPLPGVDSMYSESSEDVDIRMGYYNIFGVPSSVVDGNYFIGSSANLIENISTTISERATVLSNFQINFSEVQLEDNYIAGNVNISKTESSNLDNLHLFIVLIEKLVLKSSYESTPGTNNETKYNNVVRKMLSSSYGEDLVFTGNEAIVSFNWNINNFKDLNELRIVAFIQNTETKEIFQSAFHDPEFVSIKSNQYKPNVNIYPNPVHDKFSLQIDSPISGNNIKIINIQGKILHNSYTTDNRIYSINIRDYQQGMYFLSVDDRKYVKFIKY